ncbi:hypothetical protein ACH79_33385 [Bradyrhizobium sp. CCBAU 051011]|uniref:hypothetical protein n=1 Tax=Bradyrhizobium sp. CCBAU 051011 TaxID=858422 RepID=UPI0013745528|nr:hypothetical protein [Bradyrhizobium sp. CCBAU 051011]QHO76799.1 hypothetical protein ACH79_33385 [Bradyrhizobium sp. CCBAU 051011]
MTDKHLGELMRQCATATPFGRLAVVEQQAVFDWLIGGEHITRTGKALERPRLMPVEIARTTDGQPIYAPDADLSPTETVIMK